MKGVVAHEATVFERARWSPSAAIELLKVRRAGVVGDTARTSVADRHLDEVAGRVPRPHGLYAQVKWLGHSGVSAGERGEQQRESELKSKQLHRA
jgi:hypothetical protein